MLYFLQQLLNGLHTGALYALLGFGYALTNGVLKRTNLAYGPLFAFAGQVLILAAVFGWRVLWLTLPATVTLGVVAAMIYGWLAAAVLGRSLLQPLSRQSPNAIVVATLGVCVFLMELARIAADTRDFWLPPMLADPVVFASADGFTVTLTIGQLANCAVAALAIAAASAALHRSQPGRLWRAVSDDPLAAALCGVDAPAVFRATVVAGGLLAALAGVMAALYYGNISFGTGMIFGLKVLFVTAVGGYREPVQAAAGGCAFGIAESLWSGYFPIEWRDAWVFGLLVALLVFRPAVPTRPD